MEAEEKVMVTSLPEEEALWNGRVVQRARGYSEAEEIHGFVKGLSNEPKEKETL